VPRNHVFKLIEIISLLAVRRPAVTSHSGRTGSRTLRTVVGRVHLKRSWTHTVPFHTKSTLRQDGQNVTLTIQRSAGFKLIALRIF
jgi:archaellin